MIQQRRLIDFSTLRHDVHRMLDSESLIHSLSTVANIRCAESTSAHVSELSMPICRALPGCLSLVREPRQPRDAHKCSDSGNSLRSRRTKSTQCWPTLNSPLAWINMARSKPTLNGILSKDLRKSLLIVDAILQHCRRAQSPNMG